MLKLEFKDHRKPGIWLVESTFKIGSSPRNHLVLTDDGISEFHAEIRLEDGHSYLSDLKSFKGTFVNGQKITERFQLRAGDAVSIGGVEFELIESQSQSARKTAAGAKADWTLMALTGEHKGKTFPMHGSVTIGRSSQSDISINDEHMSRRHAEVSLKNGVLRIIDLNSSNGTRVNGVKITDQVLKPGDKISFDQVTFLVTGPANAPDVAVPDDDDEVTVFRGVASMPKAPATPRPVASSSATVQSTARTSSASAAPVTEHGNDEGSSKLPMIVVGVIVVIILAGAGLFMAGAF